MIWLITCPRLFMVNVDWQGIARTLLYMCDMNFALWTERPQNRVPSSRLDTAADPPMTHFFISDICLIIPSVFEQISKCQYLEFASGRWANWAIYARLWTLLDLKSPIGHIVLQIDINKRIAIALILASWLLKLSHKVVLSHVGRWQMSCCRQPEVAAAGKIRFLACMGWQAGLAEVGLSLVREPMLGRELIGKKIRFISWSFLCMKLPIMRQTARPTDTRTLIWMAWGETV